MAHNLNFNTATGQHAFFSVKQPAWHGLGTIVQDYPTSRETIAFAGLDYNVVKAPLFAKGADPLVSFAVPEQFATMRTDNHAIFGVVGTGLLYTSTCNRAKKSSANRHKF